MKNFNDVLDAHEWFDSLPSWKQKLMAFHSSPFWPFMVNHQKLPATTIKNEPIVFRHDGAGCSGIRR